MSGPVRQSGPISQATAVASNIPPNRNDSTAIAAIPRIPHIKKAINFIVCIIALFGLFLFVGAADARIPRSHAALVQFAKSHPCPSTGQPIPHCPQFILDHFVPLACKGFDGPRNLRWMAEEAALRKDRWERKECAALKAIEKRNHGVAPDQDFRHPTWYVDGPHK